MVIFLEVKLTHGACEGSNVPNVIGIFGHNVRLGEVKLSGWILAAGKIAVDILVVDVGAVLPLTGVVAVFVATNHVAGVPAANQIAAV